MAQPPATQFSGIFVSYRRDDSSGHAGRLFDHLVRHFGKDRIFIDSDIEPGEDFVEVIENAVGSCEILVAIIGRHWLSGADETTRRLDNPNDFVRLEIATALKRNVRVIPVLVQKATMPNPHELPENIAPISRRNAIEFSDTRWQYDVAKLIKVLEKVLAERQAARAAEEERHRQEEEVRRREEEEKQLRLAAEEAKQRAAEERRVLEEKDRRAAKERAKNSAAQTAARQTEAERRGLEERERRRTEGERLRLAEEATKRRVAEEGRRQEEEKKRREAAERPKQEAHDASRRRTEEERALAEAESRKIAEGEAERVRVEAEQESARRRLAMKKKTHAEKECIRQETEVGVRTNAAEQALQDRREEKPAIPDPPVVAGILSPSPITRLSNSFTMFGVNDVAQLRAESTKRTTLLVIIASVALAIIGFFIWMSKRPGGEKQAATNQQAAQITSVPTTYATPTPTPTPEPIPTPDKVAFEKSLTAFIKKDKEMAQVVKVFDSSHKTDEIRKLRRVAYGDLDGDSAEDAAVWFCGENAGVGQNYWCKLVAFRNIKGVLTYAASYIWYQDAWASSDLRSITRDGKILVTEQKHELGNPTSPLIKSQTKIILDGKKLKEVRQ